MFLHPRSTSPAPPPPHPTELTKNEHYCVSRFPGFPKIPPTSLINGYTDHVSRFGLVVSDAIHVWNYRSADARPLSIQFPLPTPDTLAILTRPNTGRDPGILICTPDGRVKFYESVQHAPALGLIDNRMMDLQIPLRGEKAVLVSNVEPHGVAVATSSHRVFLVGLCDASGRPALSCRELATRSLIPFWDHHTEIVAVRACGSSIIVQESGGKFHLIGDRNIRHDLSPHVKASVDGYLPGANLSVDFCDMWALEEDDYYLGLCRVEENFRNKSLLLLTIKINETGVMVYGSHRLKTEFEPSLAPKLFLPNPRKTAFVLLGNAVLVTDIDIGYIKAASKYYQPRWEDTIRFKDSVGVVGYGYEDKVAGETENPSLILITTSSGILRIERFSESDAPSSALDIVKSRVEQAVFYNAAEIDFEVGSDRKTTYAAVSSVCAEVMAGESAYLPRTMASVAELIALKLRVLRKLHEMVDPSSEEAFYILTCLEKVALGGAFHEVVNKGGEAAAAAAAAAAGSVPLRTFFSHHLDNINAVFTKFVSSNVADLPQTILHCMYPVLELEREYESSFLRKSWIFETDLLLKIEDNFSSTLDNESLLRYVDILYHFVTSAIRFMEHTDDPQLRDYSKWYRTRKHAWVSKIISRGLASDAVAIVEHHRDFVSLARLLECQKQLVLDDHGRTSPQFAELNIRYVHYFETYHYDFASALYDHYLASSHIQALLLDFTNYKHHLLRYFDENPDKTRNCAWIRRLLDRDYASAARSLSRRANESIVDSEFKLSVAKLGLVAASAPASSVAEIDNALVPLRIQKRLKAVIESTTYDAYKKHMAVENAPIAEETFAKLSNNLQLSSWELIDVLTTLIHPYANAYADALRVAALIENDEHFKKAARLIWLRLLVLPDDWDSILASMDRDHAAKASIVGSFLYKTIDAIKANEVLCAEASRAGGDSDFDRALDGARLEKALPWVESIKREIKIKGH